MKIAISGGLIWNSARWFVVTVENIIEERCRAAYLAYPAGVEYDRLWERLLDYINEWASAREVPGGIEVRFEQPPGVIRIVEMVISPADWDDYNTTIYGTGDPS